MYILYRAKEYIRGTLDFSYCKVFNCDKCERGRRSNLPLMGGEEQYMQYTKKRKEKKRRGRGKYDGWMHRVQYMEINSIYTETQQRGKYGAALCTGRPAGRWQGSTVGM